MHKWAGPSRADTRSTTDGRHMHTEIHQHGETLPASNSTSSTSSSTLADPPLDEKLDAPTTPISPDAPKRIAIFVEPSPFTYVSGYKNRFTTMIKYLVAAGCEVLVVTTGAAMQAFSRRVV